jgi:hypothetical protein
MCLGFYFGVFNNNSIISKLNESNYYENVHQELQKDTEEIVQKAGFPTTVLDEVITLDRVYVGCKNYMNNTLAGKKSQIKTEKLRNKLNENINQYITKQNIRRTEKLNKGITALVSRIENEYKNRIQLQFLDYFHDNQVKFMNLMKFMIPAVIIIIGILCYFLIRMHHYKHRGVRYITYALIASSFMTMFLSLYVMITKRYQNTEITPEYYRDFVNAYLKWDVMVFINMAGIGLLLAVAMISLVSYLKKQITNS